MTFSLDDIKPTLDVDAPLRIMIYANDKVGKTTFGAAADKAIFIPTETGQKKVVSSAFPLCKTWEDVIGAIGVLWSEDHDYKTVVLDTLDWAERLAQTRVAKNYSQESIASDCKELSYGAGYRMSADLMDLALKGLDELQTKKGMEVILLAHADTVRFNDPMSEPYDRYQIKCHKFVTKLAKEWVDILGFAQLETYTSETKEGFGKKRTRVTDAGQRILRLTAGAAYDAGSRLHLPPSVDFTYAALKSAVEESKKNG